MVEGRCEREGSYPGRSCEGAVEYLPNPFVAEVYNDIEMEWLCEYHYGEIADDI